MRVGAVLVSLCVGLGACTNSNSIECGSVICSSLSVCNPAGTGCVLQTQVDACQGKSDEDACTYPGASTAVCVTGVCIELGCGNGHVDVQLGELCDDGNRLSGDGCSSDCKSKEICGDGAIDYAIGEQCDAGDANSNAPGAACRVDCKPRRCGDAILDPGEACDDGNTEPGDGCRADCQGRWTQMNSATFGSLYGVSALSANDAYAVGEQEHLLHWNGTAWARLAGPNTGLNVSFSKVVAISDTQIIVLEGRPNFWIYNGATWTSQATATGMSWKSVSATGPSDIWIVGTTGTGAGAFDHWNGASWQLVTDTSLPNALTDVYAVPGGLVYATDSTNHAVKLALSAPYASAVSGTPIGSLVSGASASDISLFGATGGKHFNGTTWSTMTNGSELSPPTDLSAVAGQQVVTGGNGGTMVCDGAACSAWSTGLFNTLEAVSAYAKDRAFIVGDGGVILY